MYGAQESRLLTALEVGMTRWNRISSEAREKRMCRKRLSLVLWSVAVLVLLALGVVLHLGTASADSAVWSTPITEGVSYEHPPLSRMVNAW